MCLKFLLGNLLKMNKKPVAGPSRYQWATTRLKEAKLNTTLKVDKR